MTAAQAHAAFERILAEALRAPDPVAALHAAAADPGLPAALRKALMSANEDGVRLSALLVARLRFERLIHGSPEAARWFEEDPAAFTAAFRRYHQAVPASSFFPRSEAERFEAWWCAASDTDRPA
ncbi:MAG TPA: hypothetical protein VH877_33835 [Polyangia bacterium]|nr:hypothetical protein [Polyangia bacterium]